MYKQILPKLKWTRGIALCSKSNGRCDIKAEKRKELESKSSHKSDKYHSIYKNENFETRFVRDKPPLPKMSALIA